MTTHITPDALMRELEQLRGECVLLRNSLERISTFANQWGCSDEAVIAKNALASSPLSEKYAAVVRAAEDVIALDKKTRTASEHYHLYQLLRQSVDALTEKETPTDGEL